MLFRPLFAYFASQTIEADKDTLALINQFAPCMVVALKTTTTINGVGHLNTGLFIQTKDMDKERILKKISSECESPLVAEVLKAADVPTISESTASLFMLAEAIGSMVESFERIVQDCPGWADRENQFVSIAEDINSAYAQLENFLYLAIGNICQYTATTTGGKRI